MEDNNQVSDKKANKKINIGYIFGIIMIVTYFGMAYLLLFTKIFNETFSSTMRYIFAAVFSIYGVFRAYRFIKHNGYKKY